MRCSWCCKSVGDLHDQARQQQILLNLILGRPHHRERYSDPDASWGHRSAVSTRKGGGFYGYKIDAAVCVRTDLPVAWGVRTASVAELHAVPSLLDAAKARGFSPQTMIADKGYDYGPVHAACADRGVLPIIARRRFANEKPIETPSCEHGAWTFAGADVKCNATKWRCPFRECFPMPAWIKADRRHRSSLATPNGSATSTAGAPRLSASSAA